jgi:hypothetical protein
MRALDGSSAARTETAEWGPVCFVHNARAMAPSGIAAACHRPTISTTPKLDLSKLPASYLQVHERLPGGTAPYGGASTGDVAARPRWTVDGVAGSIRTRCAGGAAPLDGVPAACRHANSLIRSVRAECTDRVLCSTNEHHARAVNQHRPRPSSSTSRQPCAAHGYSAAPSMGTTAQP